MPANNSVGFLLATNPSDWGTYLSWFKTKLRTLNPAAGVKVYPPGGAGGEWADVLQAATDLVNEAGIKVIVTAGTQGALACKQATQANPKNFVFASVGDAQLSGLMPSGHFTGGSNGQVTYVPERVTHMLSNAIFVDKFAVVGNHNNQPVQTAMDRAITELTNRNKQVLPANQSTLTPGDEIATFIDGLAAKGVKSLYVCSDLWLTVHSTELNLEAHRAGMKTMWEIEEQRLIHFADDACGVSFKDMFETAAVYVNQILTGTLPGALPLYQPPLSHTHIKRKPKKKSQPSKKASQKKGKAKKRPASAKKTRRYR